MAAHTRALVPLRLAHFPCCLLPAEWDDAAALKTVLEATRDRQRYVYEPDMVVYSRSLDEHALGAFIAAIGASEHTDNTFSLRMAPPGSTRESHQLTAAVANPAHFVAGRRDFGTRATMPTYLRRSKTIVSVDSPVTFRPGIGGEVRVRFSGPSALGIPKSRSAVKLFDRNAIQAQGYVEVQTWPANRFTFNLDIPNRSSVLATYLQDRGIDHELSDKGRLASGVVNAIPDIARLRSPIAIRLIDALTTHRFEHELREARRQLHGLNDEQLDELARRLLNVRQETRTLEQVFGELRQAGTEVERPQVGATLNELADAGIVVRGLEVDCRLCGMKSFLELRDTTAPAVCPGCRGEAHYSHDDKGQPAIHYRLNALVDRVSDQGVIGHVVAAAALREMFGESDVVTLPGVNLTLSGGSRKEVDALALVRDKVWCGEAKPRSEALKEEQIQRDLEVAQAVGASTYLMVCLAGLDDAEIQRALELATPANMQLAVLGSADGAIRILSARDLSSCRDGFYDASRRGRPYAGERLSRWSRAS